MSISATADAEREPYSPIADRSIASSSAGTATHGDVTRRLTNAKVRAIFECLHHHTPPPPNLPFTIVPVGAHGKDLSPPSFEFEYGLYILLRPAKLNKRKNLPVVVPQAPSHLQHLVMTEFPPETCKWQLSGPQFPQPTAIQQRYCYPRGRKEYSQCTGSALWTMYNSDGMENKEYRLLHVYYSSKRLFNGSFRGNDVSLNHEDDLESQSSRPTMNPFSRKPPKRRKSTSVTVPPFVQRNHISPVIVLNRNHTYSHDLGGGSLPTSPIGLDHHAEMNPATSLGSFDHNSSHGYVVSPPTSWPDVSIVTTDQANTEWAQHYRRPQAPYQRFYSPLQFQQTSHDVYSSEDSVGGSTIRDDTQQHMLPFRQRDLQHFDIHDHHPPILQSPSFGLHTSTDLTITIPRLGDDMNDDDLGSIPGSVDSFSWDEDMPTELTSANDPFGEISYSFSREHGIETHATNIVQDLHHSRPLDHFILDPPATDEEASFASSLHLVHERLRDRIYSAPTNEQPELIHAFAAWARRLAQDPLGSAAKHSTLHAELEDATGFVEKNETSSRNDTVDAFSDVDTDEKNTVRHG